MSGRLPVGDPAVRVHHPPEQELAGLHAATAADPAGPRGGREWACGADLEEEKKKLEELLEEVRVEATTVVRGVPQHLFDPYREREDFCRMRECV